MNPNSVKYARDESITKHFTVLKCSINRILGSLVLK